MITDIHWRQTMIGLVLLFSTSLATSPVSADDRKDSTGTSNIQVKDKVKGSTEDTKEGKLVLGELLKIEGEFYLIKKSDGKEVKLHVGDSTQQLGAMKSGDRIEAQVDDNNHVLSIHGEGSTDRRDSHYPDLTRK